MRQQDLRGAGEKSVYNSDAWEASSCRLHQGDFACLWTAGFERSWRLAGQLQQCFAARSSCCSKEHPLV